MKIKNFTPHILRVRTPKGGVDLPSEGIARVSYESKIFDWVHVEDINIPVYTTTHTEVTGLPAAEADTYIIVSSIVKAACPDRKDLVCPVYAVKDKWGNVIACRGVSI